MEVEDRKQAEIKIEWNILFYQLFHPFSISTEEQPWHCWLDTNVTSAYENGEAPTETTSEMIKKMPFGVEI